MKLALGRLGSAGTRTLIQRAIASLRARGTDAHLWLPGVGTINGLTTGNYLESTGNTVATVDNPTGLVLDALGSVGVELVTNGGFDSDSGWTKGTGWSIAGGKLVATACPAYSNVQQVASGVIAGKAYLVTFDIAVTAGGIALYLGTSANNIQVSTTKTYSGVLYSTGGGWVRIDASNIGFTGTIDNISVREVSGIHLTQTTTANKPVLRRGLVNLLTYSKTVGGTSWALLGGLTSSGLVTAPDGTNTANTFLVSGSAYLQHNISGFASGASGTVAIWAKQSASGAANGIRLTTNNASAWSTGISQYFPLTPTWQLIVLSGVLQTGGASTTISYGAQLADASSDPNCYGNVDLVDAGCFLGTLTAAQILAAGGIPVTTTAAASNPDAGRYSWSFDGSDYIATSAPAFQVTDDSCVIAGANCTDVSAAYRIVVNPAGNTADNYSAGAICFEMTTGKLFSSYSTATGSTVLMSAVNDTNTPLVVSTRAVGNTRTLRKNAVVQQTTTVALGSSTYTSGSVGSNTGGSYGSRFHGTLGPVLTIKGTVTDAELLMYERLIAALTPGAPTF